MNHEWKQSLKSKNKEEETEVEERSCSSMEREEEEMEGRSAFFHNLDEREEMWQAEREVGEVQEELSPAFMQYLEKAGSVDLTPAFHQYLDTRVDHQYLEALLSHREAASPTLSEDSRY